MTPNRRQEVHAKIRQLIREHGGAMTLDEAAQLLRHAEILDEREIRELVVEEILAAAGRAAATLGVTTTDLLLAVQEGDEAARAALRAETSAETS
jgi:hypothetical protein